jgi:hypothetical protein
MLLKADFTKYAEFFLNVTNVTKYQEPTFCRSHFKSSLCDVNFLFFFKETVTDSDYIRSHSSPATNKMAP